MACLFDVLVGPSVVPLRRHPALAPLSREHHHALLLARGLKRGASDHLRATLPHDERALAAHVCGVFDAELAPHFAIEEELVVPAARGRDGSLDAVCDAVLDEHARLGAMIAELRAPATSPMRIAELLDAFGTLLELHVRNEERVLYERVQDVLDETALAALGARIARTDLDQSTRPRGA